MSSNNFFKSDIFPLYDIVQASMIVYPKEVIIATLRDIFSKDSYYYYSKDQWGFANTTDHSNLPLGADMPYGAGSNPDLSLTNQLSTRLFIGENYRYDVVYYPAILVKNGGSKSVPISFNRDKYGVWHEDVIYVDGYGNQTNVSRPKYLYTAGAWEGSVVIDVMTRSLRSRDDLVEIIAMTFTELRTEDLIDIGISIRPINIGPPSETDDRNDKLFRQSLTLDCRTEWRREIPISNVVEAILFSADFRDIQGTGIPASPNLRIDTEVTVADVPPLT